MSTTVDRPGPRPQPQTLGNVRALPTSGSAAARHAGRVGDLEAHVAPEWWRTLFDALYLKTDGDVFENDHNTRADVGALIAAAALQPGHRVLDLCCGQGRHAIELARRGFRHVTGIDQSRPLIELAQRRARAARAEVAFIEADARTADAALDPFDCVAILGNSFGYFDAADDDAALLARTRASLRPGGCLVLDLVDGEWLRLNFAKQSWEWIDDRLMVCRERALSQRGDRLITREIVIDAARGIVADRFFAERLYGRARITALLKELGFEA